MGMCGFCLMTSGTDRWYLRGLVCVCVSEATLGNEVRVHEKKVLFFVVVVNGKFACKLSSTLKSHSVWKDL